jgi:hypothetical protein
MRCTLTVYLLLLVVSSSIILSFTYPCIVYTYMRHDIPVEYEDTPRIRPIQLDVNRSYIDASTVGVDCIYLTRANTNSTHILLDVTHTAGGPIYTLPKSTEFHGGEIMGVNVHMSNGVVQSQVGFVSPTNSTSQQPKSDYILYITTGAIRLDMTM